MNDTIIVVPFGTPVAFRFVLVPLETATGIVDGITCELIYDSRVYHSLTPPLLGGEAKWLDLESGEPVTIRFQEYPGEVV